MEREALSLVYAINADGLSQLPVQSGKPECQYGGRLFDVGESHSYPSETAQTYSGGIVSGAPRMAHMNQ